MITPFGSREDIHHSTNEGAGSTSVCAECAKLVILDESDGDLRSCRDCAGVNQKSVERSFPQVCRLLCFCEIRLNGHYG